jgi:hypothetical protein
VPPDEGWLEPLPDETLPEPEPCGAVEVGAGAVEVGAGAVEVGSGAVEVGAGAGEVGAGAGEAGAGALVAGVAVVGAEAIAGVTLGLGLRLGWSLTAGGLGTGATRAIVTIGWLTGATGAA